MATSPGPGYRSALRHRDFRVLMVRYALSGIGSWAYIVALMAFVYEQTGSPAWVAAASIARFGPQFLVSSYAGVIAERFERTRVMLVSDLGALAAMVGLVVVALLDAPAGVAIALAAVTSALTILEEPAVAALVPQVVGEDDLAAANALYRVIDNLNVVAGPAVGALVLVLTSTAGTFAVNAASFAVAAVLVGRLRTRSTPSDVTHGGAAGLLGQLAVGLRAVVHDRDAVMLVGFTALSSFVWGLDTVLFPVLGTALGLGPNGFGTFLTGLGIGGVLAGAVVNRIARSPRLGAVMGVGVLAFSLPTAFLPVVEEPEVAFALQVVRGAAVLVVEVLAVTSLQRSLPPELIARVFGIFLTLQIGGMALGAAVAPALLRVAGLDPALVLVGVGVPALLSLTVPRLVHMDRTATRRLDALADRIDLLEHLEIFATASRPVLEQLAAAAEEIVVPAGTAVVREGDAADALYVVVDGELEVTAVGEGAGARHLRVLTAPSYFGEIGVIGRMPRTATVETLVPTTLYRIDGDRFLQALAVSAAAPAFLESAHRGLAATHPELSERVRVDPAAPSVS